LLPCSAQQGTVAFLQCAFAQTKFPEDWNRPWKAAVDGEVTDSPMKFEVPPDKPAADISPAWLAEMPTPFW